MKIALPKEVLGSLPEPDGQGLVRASVTLEIGQDGQANIIEINDTPIPSDDAPNDDANPMPVAPEIPENPEAGY